VRITRQIAYLETAINDAGGDLVSKGTGTFLVRRKDSGSPSQGRS
jgi:acyl-coenzyme A thioesterase PaaI-like protein